MISYLKRDLNAIMERDPAASNKFAAIFLYPSFQVMLAYRLSHQMWLLGLHFLPRLLMQIARILTGIEIHPAAKIGPGFFIDHGMGTVIGETAEIGSEVTLYHDVTLGGVMPAVDSDKQRQNKRHPTVCDYAIIGAGAQILGPITVHRCARVGGNSVVTRDVPEGATVVGVPARQLSKVKPVTGSGPGFMPYAVHYQDELDDPRESIIKALVGELQGQRAHIESLEQRLNDVLGKAVPKRAETRLKPKANV